MFVTQNIEKWLGYDFEAGECKTSDEFSAFARNLKSEIRAQLKGTGYTIVGFSKGYFFVSGFIHNEKNGRYMYFSVDDVRYSQNWHRDVLVREARNEKDYRGGNNRYTSLESFKEAATGILESDYSQFAA